MTRAMPFVLAAGLGLMIAVPAATAADRPDRVRVDVVPQSNIDTRQPALDPVLIFERLVERYRTLEVYEDVAHVTQVTQHDDGTETDPVNTEITCSVQNGNLDVRTVGTQLAREIGLRIPGKLTRTLQQARDQYNMWLAPHMSLRFQDHPLRDFRRGIDEGFTPTEAKRVKVDDKPMVHLELRSGDGESEDVSAIFELFIDPESGLIERIEGEQRLPDGGSYQTTLDITPMRALSAEDIAEDEAPPADADDVKPPTSGGGVTTPPIGLGVGK